MSQTDQTPGFAEKFVAFVIERIHADNGFRGKLSRASNESTEYQSWEILANWCDLDKEWERLPFALIGASLAKSRPLADGRFGIGQAIAKCYEDGNQSDQAKAKLRRLLACKSTVEACQILRPLLSLIESKGGNLCFARLLQDLLRFNVEWTPAKWAQDFYGKSADEEGGE